jgi:2-phosphosulfolactate phosphatase
VPIDVAFTPAESAAAPTGVVIDVIRATSTICQALASGYERVLCTAEIEEARELREELDGAVLGGERENRVIPGFDLGNSPREYVEPKGADLILTTTNGTRAIVAAAARCDRVFVASLRNLGVVVNAVREAGEHAVVVCAGVQGTFALDDAFVAGRIVSALDWQRSDAAEAAARLVSTWSEAEEAFRASKSGRNLLQNARDLEDDLPFCAEESVLDVVPRFVRMHGAGAEIVA